MTFEEWLQNSNHSDARLLEYFINRSVEYSLPVTIKKLFNKWKEFRHFEDLIKEQGTTTGA